LITLSKTKETITDLEVAEEAADLRETSKTAKTDLEEAANAAEEADMTVKQITKLDTTFSPATKSTTQDLKATKTARMDKLLTEDVEEIEAAGVEVAEAVTASGTGKLRDPFVKTKMNSPTTRKKLF
jgi:phosphate uptake regulator